MQRTSVQICCPHCKLPVKAVLKDGYRRFLLYTCPRCRSNVVLFKNKVELISDHLLKKLIKSNKLQHCGDMVFRSQSTKPHRDAPISEDDIKNLRILLNTSQDLNDFISKL